MIYWYMTYRDIYFEGKELIQIRNNILMRRVMLYEKILYDHTL